MKSIKKFNTTLILFTVLFLITSIILGVIYKNEPSESKIHKSFQTQFQKKERMLLDEIEKICSFTEDNGYLDYDDFYLTERDNFLSIFVFYNNYLKYWSTNKVPFDFDGNYALSLNQKLIELENGFYYSASVSFNDYVFIGLIPIYYNYPYQNAYLNTGFSELFDIPHNYALSFNYNGTYPIKNLNGQIIFDLIKTDNASAPQIPYSVVFFSYIMFFLCLFLLVWKFLLEYFKLNISIPIISGLFFIFILLFKLLQQKFHLPSILYEHAFFSPLYFAWKTWLSSLGDLLLNIIYFTFFSILVYYEYSKNKVSDNNIRYKWIYSSICILLVCVLFLIVCFIAQIAVINSTLTLNFYNIFNLKNTDIAGFVAIALLVIGFLFSTYVLFKRAKLNNKFFNTIKNYSIIVILLFTLTFGYILQNQNQVKEKMLRNLYAVALSDNQDMMGEYVFSDISEKIKKDSLLVKLIEERYNKEDINDYLRKNYLSGYFSNYHIQTTLCKCSDYLMIMPENTEVPCTLFFYSIIERHSIPTPVENLYYIDKGGSSANYIYKLPVKFSDTTDNDSINLFLEMISIPKMSGLGYPELLVDDKFSKNQFNYDYHYSIYNEGSLVQQYGEYSYPLSLSSFDSTLLNNSFFSFNNYSHLISHYGEDTTIIVSLPEKSFFEKIAQYSYLLLIFTISFLTVNFFISIFSGKYSVLLLSFRNRLQIATISLVLVSFIIAGIITVDCFIKFHNKKTNENIREKTYSLLVELEHKLNRYETITIDDRDYLSELLQKFSNVFFTDINLYDLNGKLIATSRPQVFQEGIVSSLMSPEALNDIKHAQTPFFQHSEYIGNMKYTSAYMLFKNYDNKIIAYLNLPYFARENEIQKEISAFLVTFINFYVFLIIFAIILSLIISNYVALPLKIISQKLRFLRPGIKNEKILWNKKDELGMLIKEYNRMVDELDASTQQLMQTERETAWREMAKQIAHEIKNPLTPMKLSVQSLERSWNEKVPDFEKRLSKTSQTLIEQIDTLSLIATEFSNFAKMPDINYKYFNLVSLIKHITDLFENEYINISLHYDNNENYQIYFAEAQIIQIVNNLIKNAVESLQKNKEGSIEIIVKKEKNNILISVTDNGCGIPDNMKEKIFSPYFTTGSGGTGLGLAITKKIVDSLKGTISFETEENKGTTFYITLPI